MKERPYGSARIYLAFIAKCFRSNSVRSLPQFDWTMKAVGIATPSKFQHLNVKYYDELYTGNSTQDKKVKQISEELYIDPSFHWDVDHVSAFFVPRRSR